MKIIAVTQRIDSHPNRNEYRDALDQKLNEFLIFCDFLPVPVPNNLLKINFSKKQQPNSLEAWLLNIKPFGLILSGGNDIGEHDSRDMTENFLLDYAKIYNLPVLGICRGMQIMAKWAGVNLKKLDGHIKTRHNLIGKISENVNSYHLYTLDNCPKGFEVIARSDDNEIEAIKHKKLSWEGWMWHPEREIIFKNWNINRTKKLFDN